MPKVIKQSVRKKKVSSPSTNGLASRILPVNELPELGIKINFYGRSKTGKTRLASTFPKPLLILGTEQGTRSIANVEGVDFVMVDNSSDLDDVERIVKSKYKSVVLDTAGGLQDLVLKEILGLDELPLQRSWGMARREDWGTCGIQVKQRLRALLDMADTDGVNVVIVAHERNFNDESNSDVLFPTVGSALSPSVTNWLNGACDFICQTFIRQRTEERVVKIGDKKKSKSVETDDVEFCLRTGPNPIYMTGFRRPDTGKKLPDVIVDPNYKKIAEIIE